MRFSDLAKQYNRGASTICTILKQKKTIKAMMPAKSVTIISKFRTSVHEEMGRLLLLWLTEKQIAGDTVIVSIICAKARDMFRVLVKETPGSGQGIGGVLQSQSGVV